MIHRMVNHKSGKGNEDREKEKKKKSSTIGQYTGMKFQKMKFINILLVGLGLFEFFAAFEYYNANGAVDNSLLPPILKSSNLGLQMIWITYTITLGCSRLCWAFSKPTLLNYVPIVLTHFIETCMWWALALEPHFNTKNQNLQEILTDALSLNCKGGLMTSVLLIGVPFLTSLFSVFCFPSETEATKTKKQ